MDHTGTYMTYSVGQLYSTYRDIKTLFNQWVPGVKYEERVVFCQFCLLEFCPPTEPPTMKPMNDFWSHIDMQSMEILGYQKAKSIRVLRLVRFPEYRALFAELNECAFMSGYDIEEHDRTMMEKFTTAVFSKLVENADFMYIHCHPAQMFSLIHVCRSIPILMEENFLLDNATLVDMIDRPNQVPYPEILSRHNN